MGVLEKVSEHYNKASLSDRETLIAEQIFRLLMKDTEQFARAVLAEKLKENPVLPRDIVLHLANDHADVSTPVLSCSAVLSDADLIQIIEATQEIAKLQAIAGRENVSTRVAGALVDTSYPNVITTLLGNEGASLEIGTLEKLVQDFAADDSIMLAMAARANLPATLVDRLMQHASTAVTKTLQKHHKVGVKLVEKAVSSVQESTVLQLLERNVSEKDIADLVQQMYTEGRLNASIVLSAVCRGHLGFVRAAIAKLAGIPVSNATKLLGDKGGLGVRAIYTRTQMPESMFGAVNLLLRIAHELEGSNIAPGSQAYANAAVERLLTHPQAKEVDNLPYIMALLRQQPGR